MIRKKWEINETYKEASIAILQDNLPALRARIGINQEEIANVIGLSRQTYYTLENKNRRMSWSIYLALIFFFSACTESAEMLKELRIYPIDLVMRFNEQL